MTELVMTDVQAKAARPPWHLAVGSVALALVGLGGVVAAVTAISRHVLSVDQPLGVRFAWVVGAANLGLLAITMVRLWCPPWRATNPTPAARRVRSVVTALAGLVGSLVVVHWIIPLEPMLALASAWVLVVLCAGAVLRVRSALAQPFPSRLARIAVSIVVLVVGGWLWAVLAFFLGHAQLSVLPTRVINSSPPIDTRIGERAIETQTSDGLTLRGTYTPGRPGAPGVVLCHGVSNGQKQMAGIAADLAALGYHTVRFDFRGHGISDGTVCTFTGRETRDVRAAFDWLAAQPGVDGQRMVLIGNSMGGGAVLRATRELPRDRLRAVVAFAPASDLELMADYRLQAVGPIGAPTKAIIAGLGCALGDGPFTAMSGSDALDEVPDLPVLVFHGTIDVTIPPSLSETLRARHPDQVDLQWVDEAGHEEALPWVVNAARHSQRLHAFLAEHTGHQPIAPNLD